MPSMTESGHVLIFEPEYGGHQPSFVRMLVEHVRSHGPGMRLTLAVPGRLIERIREEESSDFDADDQVRYHLLSNDDTERCVAGPLPARSLARWRIFSSALKVSKAEHGHFLYFDHMQLPLAVRARPTHGPSISGILFRPSIHEIYSGERSTLSDRLRETRKRVLYSLMLRNPRLAVAFSLDPYFEDFARRKLPSGQKVVTLPDPLSALPSGDGCSRPMDYPEDRPGSDRTKFLLFGALTGRKGVAELLEAVASLPDSARSRLEIVLAGCMDESTRGQVGSLLERHAGLRDCITIIDRFLTTGELEWLVSHCDVVLAPYQRFVGSSGTLVWAAALQKPVLAQSYGLVGELVRRFQLGEAVDTQSPDALSGAVARLLDPTLRARHRQAMLRDQFLAGRTPHDFGYTWLRALRPHLSI